MIFFLRHFSERTLKYDVYGGLKLGYKMSVFENNVSANDIGVASNKPSKTMPAFETTRMTSFLLYHE